jgi:hypothetical protein
MQHHVNVAAWCQASRNCMQRSQRRVSSRHASSRPVGCSQVGPIPRRGPTYAYVWQVRAGMDLSAKLPAEGAQPPQLVVGTLDINRGAVLPSEELSGCLPRVSATLQPSGAAAVGHSLHGSTHANVQLCCHPQRHDVCSMGCSAPGMVVGCWVATARPLCRCKDGTGRPRVTVLVGRRMQHATMQSEQVTHVMQCSAYLRITQRVALQNRTAHPLVASDYNMVVMLQTCNGVVWARSGVTSATSHTASLAWCSTSEAAAEPSATSWPCRAGAGGGAQSIPFKRVRCSGCTPQGTARILL